MVAAIWSMPFNKAKEMPLKFFLKFFTNHGLFKFKNRPDNKYHNNELYGLVNRRHGPPTLKRFCPCVAHKIKSSIKG